MGILNAWVHQRVVIFVERKRMIVPESKNIYLREERIIPMNFKKGSVTPAFVCYSFMYC
jgi:hypothetical protein